MPQHHAGTPPSADPRLAGAYRCDDQCRPTLRLVSDTLAREALTITWTGRDGCGSSGREDPMIVVPLGQTLVPEIMNLMELGTPYVRPRTTSDYWLYSALFSSTCPVALAGNEVAGAVIAFRSQDNPDDVYIQDVITHPEHRRRGVASALLTAVRDRATTWGCHRLYLTSEPDNTGAQATWAALGFTNVPGDRNTNGVSVTSDFKGPGKHRAVYELNL